VLKKYIVALVIALNILLCKFIDVFILTDTNVTAFKNADNIIENMKTTKTIIHVCREMFHHNKVPDISSVVVILLFVYVFVPITTVVNLFISTICAC
jgi:hypothetical protein